ncbi:MAG: hypothetical protein VKS61_15040 [Candidatus Sericytochromatia bacterium]|nr:hypothetical protein [Candidatus Sericytochromatia bacterium]
MPTDPPDATAPPAPEFPLWPFLETLYHWTDSQPWSAQERAVAWERFVRDIPGAPRTEPELSDPDQHDRVLRFWAWFHLDRSLGMGHGETPLAAFIAACSKDLTAEGLAVYEGLARTRFGAFKVLRQFRQTLAEDLGSGERLPLNPGPLTDELQVGDLVVGRLYPHEEGWEGDPDLHIGHVSELAGERPKLTPPDTESRLFSAMVPAKGAVMDVLDALLLQVDSPLTADDVFELVRASKAVEEVLDALYASPAYRIRYLHLRDRALLDELIKELWDTSGPLQDAELAGAEATALARTVREGLRAIAEGNMAALEALIEPRGFLPLYLELFGLGGLRRLTDTASGLPDGGIRTRHQQLPKDGGIFTTLTWGEKTTKHAVGFIAHAQPDGRWLIGDISLPEGASPAMNVAFDRAQQLGWASAEAADSVEAHLRRAIDEVGYSVHDAIDLIRMWRDFKEAASPDLTQPAIWAAGCELADTRFRNEDLDVKVLAKSYRVMPRAIEEAADQIEATVRARDASPRG